MVITLGDIHSNVKKRKGTDITHDKICTSERELERMSKYWVTARVTLERKLRVNQWGSAQICA